LHLFGALAHVFDRGIQIAEDKGICRIGCLEKSNSEGTEFSYYKFLLSIYTALRLLIRMKHSQHPSSKRIHNALLYIIYIIFLCYIYE